MNNDKMRALAAYDSSTLKIVELPIPDPDDYEVLVKNEGCSFCNTTDKMIVRNLFHTPAYPVVIGHESFGKVIKVGKKVKKFKLDDRVICSNAIVNGYNGEFYSTWGGFAEYGIAGDLEAYLADNKEIDATNAYRQRYEANLVIPNTLPADKAALVFPFAEVASAIKQVGCLKNKSVVVIGTGMVGYLFTYFAALYGAKEITALGLVEERLKISKDLGATKTFINVDEAESYIASTGGADIIFECSGNPRALEKGMPYLKEGGKLACFSVSTSPYSFNLSRCPINYSYQHIDPETDKAIDEVCDLLEKGKIPTDIFITHKWNFDDVVEAFNTLYTDTVIKGLVFFS